MATKQTARKPAAKKKATKSAAQQPADNTQKDPTNWTTGDEPMTGAQHSYLQTLSDEAGEKLDESLTKGEASQKIDKLRTGKHVIDERAEVGDDASASNTQKDPAHWATGGEPMTGAQHSYLKTLSDEAGVAFDEKLTKGEASQRIDELRQGNARAKQAEPKSNA